jgi:hypothetical protein
MMKTKASRVGRPDGGEAAGFTETSPYPSSDSPSSEAKRRQWQGLERPTE